MSYEEVRSLAGIVGLLFFVALFVGVLIYTFWPGNKKRFEEARHIPLEDDLDVGVQPGNHAMDLSSSRGENGR